MARAYNPKAIMAMINFFIIFGRNIGFDKPLSSQR
jgi:hypothetical protein